MNAHLTPGQKSQAIELAAQHLVSVVGECEIDSGDGWCNAHASDAVEPGRCQYGAARLTLRKVLAAEVVPAHHLGLCFRTERDVLIEAVQRFGHVVKLWVDGDILLMRSPTDSIEMTVGGERGGAVMVMTGDLLDALRADGDPKVEIEHRGDVVTVRRGTSPHVAELRAWPDLLRAGELWCGCGDGYRPEESEWPDSCPTCAMFSGDPGEPR